MSHAWKLNPAERNTVAGILANFDPMRRFLDQKHSSL